MKTYLVEVEDVVCIVRATDKFQAAEIIEKEFHISYVTPDYVKKLPKHGVIYKKEN